MAFCGKCGKPLDGGKFCPHCGEAVEQIQSEVTPNNHLNKTAKISLKKKLIIAGVIVCAAFAIIKLTSKTVNEPCDWCGNSPSVAYELHDGSYAYVCKECSKKCAWCGEKPNRHYENALGTMVFVCDDCYEGFYG